MERMLQHKAIRHMSDVHKSILQSLAILLYRRPSAQQAAAVPYLDVVHAVAADKTTVTTTLCLLMRRGLVRLFVPPGGWTRYVALTEQGQEYVRFLAQGDRQPRVLGDRRDMGEHEEPERRQRIPARRPERQRSRRQRRDDRRPR